MKISKLKRITLAERIAKDVEEEQEYQACEEASRVEDRYWARLKQKEE